MVLFNTTGRVLVAERNDMPQSSWQLPQGGIDFGETIEKAALRELEEEIGTAQVKLAEIARDTVVYNWPVNKNNRRRKKWRGQLITLVALEFTGHDNDINLETDQPEFRNWKWVPLEVIPQIVVPFKQSVYEYAVKEFTSFRDQIQKGAL